MSTRFKNTIKMAGYVILSVLQFLIILVLWLIPVWFHIDSWLGVVFPLTGQILLYFLAQNLDKFFRGKTYSKKARIIGFFIYISIAILYYFLPFTRYPIPK